ncbi:MAG TPA: hypothetical protein VFP22_00300 [Candidatus Limnocylindrales bacterium]|nr:hypothetical protein [Candidatus Limnocylindrales bacterium]
MAIWQKFNPRERLEVIGAGVIILGYLVGLTNYGVGGSVIALIAAIAVLVILYVKSAPNMKVAWPADPSLINLVISGIAALFVLIGFLSWIGILGVYGGTALIALLLTVVGTAILVWGAWQEYSVVKPAMPAFMNAATPGSQTPAAPPAGSTPPAGDDHQPPA